MRTHTAMVDSLQLVMVARNHTGRQFISLHTDVLLQILREMCIADILALRQTCQSLNAFTRARSVWHDAWQGMVYRQGLPLPGLHGQPLASLEAQELERLTVKALRLHRNWTSERPQHTRHADIFPPGLPEGAHARNLAVHFLPGRGNRWLLTITFYDQHGEPRQYAIHCWDIVADPPQCVATLRCKNMAGAIVNSDPIEPGILAIIQKGSPDQATTTVFNIDFSAEDVNAAFIPLQSFPSYGIPFGLQGSMIMSYDFPIAFQGKTLVATGVDNIVRLVNTETGQLRYRLRVPLEHDDPTLRNEGQRCMAAVLLGDYVLTFCRQWIHLYATNRSTPQIDADAVPSCDPIASHKWHWRIDSLVVSPRREPSHRAHDSREYTFPPIDVLLRFDTTRFPWPVNILHHYVLYPNPSRHESDHSIDVPYLSLPAGGPVVAHSIPSPIRLFTPSDMVLGRYGTALWLDAQSYDEPSQASDHGQRIAGKMLALPSQTSKVKDDTVNWAHGPYEDDDGSVSTAPFERPKTMLFHIQERDYEWNQLAIDEEEGRMALGTVTGKVSLFEYAL